MSKEQELKLAIVERDLCKKMEIARLSYLRRKTERKEIEEVKKIEEAKLRREKEKRIEEQKKRCVIWQQKVRRYNERKSVIRALKIAAFKTAFSLVVTVSPLMGALTYLQGV